MPSIHLLNEENVGHPMPQINRCLCSLHQGIVSLQADVVQDLLRSEARSFGGNADLKLPKAHGFRMSWMEFLDPGIC